MDVSSVLDGFRVGFCPWNSSADDASYVLIIVSRGADILNWKLRVKWEALNGFLDSDNFNYMKMKMIEDNTRH
jgi:hypothetical protein